MFSRTLGPCVSNPASEAEINRVIVCMNMVILGYLFTECKSNALCTCNYNDTKSLEMQVNRRGGTTCPLKGSLEQTDQEL